MFKMFKTTPIGSKNLPFSPPGCKVLNFLNRVLNIFFGRFEPQMQLYIHGNYLIT